MNDGQYNENDHTAMAGAGQKAAASHSQDGFKGGRGTHDDGSGYANAEGSWPDDEDSTGTNREAESLGEELESLGGKAESRDGRTRDGKHDEEAAERYRAGIEHVGLSELEEGVSEVLEAMPTERGAAAMLGFLEWRGPLPPASELMQYDEGIRDRIVRIHEMEVEASIRQKDKVIDCGVEMDQRQSAREDLLTTAEIREAYNAQIITAVINLSLVAVCVILGLNGAKEVAIAAIGALAVVNVATMFTPLRQPKQLPHGESGEAKGAEKGDEQRD